MVIRVIIIIHGLKVVDPVKRCDHPAGDEKKPEDRIIISQFIPVGPTNFSAKATKVAVGEAGRGE